MMKRPSIYVFFVSSIRLRIFVVAQGNFLPTILKSLAKFSSTKANECTSAVYFSAIIIYSLWSWHSDWTRERMWHYCLAVLCAVPCYAVWTYVGTHESFSGIIPISLYGLSFLGNMVSVAQPATLAYRTATTLWCSRASRWWSHDDSCPIHRQHPRTSDLSKQRLAMFQAWLCGFMLHVGYLHCYLLDATSLAAYGSQEAQEKN